MGADGLRIEDRQVRGVAGAQEPASLHAEDRRDVECKFMDRLLKAHDLALAHPESEQNRAVAEVGAELHMGAGVRGAHQHVGAAQDLPHRVPVAAVIGVPENRAEIFFQ